MRQAASSAYDSAATVAVDTPAPLGRVIAARFADYLTLIKPRISVLVLLTVCAGFALGNTGLATAGALPHALLGIALVAAASSALNQLLERDSDARMRRTANRPLPAERISPREVLLFGVLAGTAGTLYLAMFVNLLTAGLTAATLLAYVFAYTPLKRRTSLATAVGAIPGALPPVLGWTSAGGTLDGAAFALFAVLFLWQFPHFLAIAWMYRDEYERAGLRMLPMNGSTPRVVGLLAVGYSVALLPISLLPTTSGLAGPVYAVTALVLGLGYLLAAVRFAMHETRDSARRLLWTSLLYLPALLCVLVWDHWRLLM